MNGSDDFIGPCNLGNQTEFTVKQLAEAKITVNFTISTF